MQEDPSNSETTGQEANNDVAQTWDHLCGPDPYWRDVLEGDDE